MMRERIADDIYIFTSKRYAHVTAGAVLTQDGVVLIDTLFYPEETKAIKAFLEERLDYQVRYVINTHYHADHTQGTYLFPDAEIVGHALCHHLLNTTGRKGLERSKAQSPELEDVEIVLPELIFEHGDLTIHIGGKTLQLRHTPGHSPDLSSVHVVEDDILFAADNMMPVPTFFDGSYDQLVHSLEALLAWRPDCVVQGHGEVILRGEVAAAIESNLEYLACIKKKVTAVLDAADVTPELDNITIESCGKSRLPLNGFVAQLHRANLQRLYNDLSPQAELNNIEL